MWCFYLFFHCTAPKWWFWLELGLVQNVEFLIIEGFISSLYCSTNLTLSYKSIISTRCLFCTLNISVSSAFVIITTEWTPCKFAQAASGHYIYKMFVLHFKYISKLLWSRGNYRWWWMNWSFLMFALNLFSPSSFRAHVWLVKCYGMLWFIDDSYFLHPH